MGIKKKLKKVIFESSIKGLGLILDDLLLITGFGYVFYGVYQIYEPAGFIVLGSCLCGLAYLVAKRKEKR